MAQLTTSQAAQRLGISTVRVQKLIQAGRLEAVKYGRDWLIQEQALEAVAVRKPGRPVGYSPGRKAG